MASSSSIPFALPGFKIDRVDEHTLNWEALEPDARAAVQAQVGALPAHEHLPCPKDLAARARWE